MASIQYTFLTLTLRVRGCFVAIGLTHKQQYRVVTKNTLSKVRLPVTESRLCQLPAVKLRKITILTMDICKEQLPHRILMTF